MQQVTYIYFSHFQKGAPKEADTETSCSSAALSNRDLDDDAHKSDADKSRSSSSTRRGNSGASNAPLAGEPLIQCHDEPNVSNDNVEDEPATQLIDNAGSSGMDFVVTTATASQQVLEQEPVSNPLFTGIPDMSLSDFLKGEDPPYPKKGVNDELDPDDYQLSSTESSEEEH